MAVDRTVTFPASASQRVADQLCDWDPNLPGDEAAQRAQDLTIEVTEAVDKLRAQEVAERGDVTIPRAVAEKALETLREWHGSTVMPDVTYEQWAGRIAALETALRG